MRGARGAARCSGRTQQQQHVTPLLTDYNRESSAHSSERSQLLMAIAYINKRRYSLIFSFKQRDSKLGLVFCYDVHIETQNSHVLFVVADHSTDYWHNWERRDTSPNSCKSELTPSAIRMCVKPISRKYSSLRASGRSVRALTTLNTTPIMSLAEYPD